MSSVLSALWVVGVLTTTAFGWTGIPDPQRTTCSSSRSPSHDDSLAFDFSSSSAWEDFYRETDDATVTEWHSSVSFSAIASYCTNAASILLVGCGDSRLPDYFLQQTSPPPRLTLLDSSPTCIERLQRRYSQYPTITCVCGDVMDAVSLLKHDQQASPCVILDKGLLDALLCNDGWDTAVTQWFGQAAQVLSQGGKYVLVSYVLPKSTQAFLQALRDDWAWEFGVDRASSSNARVMVSAAVVKGRGALPSKI